MITAGLAEQQRRRVHSLREIADLRKQAAAEIDRLMEFLDASDEYVTTECEHDGDMSDAEISHAGGWAARTSEDDEPSLCGVTAHGMRVLSYCSVVGATPVEDGEQEGEDEPSLGSLPDEDQSYWSQGNRKDLEEGHDDEDDRADDEPDLGWTVDGCISGRSV